MVFLSGHDSMTKNKLIYSRNGGKCINDYRSNIDASILNEHSTGAWRYFHTQIAGYLQYFFAY